MSGRKSRSKGQRFERQVAKILQKHYQVDGTKIIRTPNSGGGRMFKGDILFKEITSDFFIECKNVEKVWDFNTMNFKTLIDWYKKAKEQNKEKNITLLIFTANRKPIFVMTEDRQAIKKVNFFIEVNQKYFIYQFEEYLRSKK